MIERKTVSQCITADYCWGWNDAVDAMPKWISVEERLPEDEVVAANFAPGTYGYKEYILGYVRPPSDTEPGGCYAINDYEVLHNVTHWLPLPPGPE